MREKRTAELSALIKQEYENSHQIYGSPRITQKLKKKNKLVSRSYVARQDRLLFPA
ncbi:IS3 family transposase [Sphingobacterium lumbrici]|uniref:IS3 family transposase n=1 Tax=Sphingobacterium lumbrici TaxID=2559600 RepID=UPI00112E998E